MTTHTAPTTNATTGEPRELARYHADIGVRRVVGQRVEGTVQLRDEPVGGAGRSYLIEQALESMSELEAIVTDYVQFANRKGFVPMRGWL